jgi:hypothetical protein
MAWYRRDKEAVAAALQRGERPDLATTMASGPLDELVAFHEELGIFAILDEVEAQRKRAGVPDELLLRTLATLPFVEQASLSGAAEVLFREPAVLLQLGWAPVQIRSGSNGRHRHPEGRQEESLPCHSDTLRDALRRVGESAWLHAQAAGVQSLYERQVVRGKVYAVDGSGLGDDLRLVALVCVSATRPIIVAWRLLSGPASEKGKEAAVTRQLVEQVLEVAGPRAIGLLLADALYADGPLLAWLKYRKGIDAQVAFARGPSALPGSARAGRWAAHRLEPPSLCAHHRRPQAAPRSGGDGGRRVDELGRLYREGCQLWGTRCQPVGLPHPRCDDSRVSRRATQPPRSIVCKPESGWLLWPFVGCADSGSASSEALRRCSMSRAAMASSPWKSCSTYSGLPRARVCCLL